MTQGRASFFPRSNILTYWPFVMPTRRLAEILGGPSAAIFITLVGAPISWLVRILVDLSVSQALPVIVNSDSQAAISIAKNLVFHERTKHVELNCHFVRQQFVFGLITLSFVPSEQQLADLFTKPLSGVPHSHLLNKLGVVSLPSNLRGDIGVTPCISMASIQLSNKQKKKLERRDEENKSKEKQVFSDTSEILEKHSSLSVDEVERSGLFTTNEKD